MRWPAVTAATAGVPSPATMRIIITPAMVDMRNTAIEGPAMDQILCRDVAGLSGTGVVTTVLKVVDS